MVGLYLYGAMRRTYSSRKLAELCGRDVACMYLVGGAKPDYHTTRRHLSIRAGQAQ